MPIRVANAPTSWGVEDPDDPANPAWTAVVEEVAHAGYAGIELGPVGFMPEDAAVLRSELAKRELRLVAGFLFTPLETPQGVAAALAGARRTCALLAGGGATELVVIQGFTPERESAAGRRGAAAPLTDPE